MPARFALVAAFTAALGLAVPAFADPPAHAPAHGWRAQQAGEHPGRYHPRYYEAGYDSRDFRDYNHLCRNNGGNRQNTVIGAILGAVSGGTVGGDDDRATSGLIGAGLAAALGSQINTGMDDCDRTQFGHAAKTSFEQSQPVYWRSPRSDARGVIHPGDYYQRSGERCRRGHAEVYMPDGGFESTEVRMCRDRNSRWRIAGD